MSHAAAAGTHELLHLSVFLCLKSQEMVLRMSAEAKHIFTINTIEPDRVNVRFYSLLLKIKKQRAVDVCIFVSLGVSVFFRCI